VDEGVLRECPPVKHRDSDVFVFEAVYVEEGEGLEIRFLKHHTVRPLRAMPDTREAIADDVVWLYSFELYWIRSERHLQRVAVKYITPEVMDGWSSLADAARAAQYTGWMLSQRRLGSNWMDIRQVEMMEAS
jgi:hypothetical protein